MIDQLRGTIISNPYGASPSDMRRSVSHNPLPSDYYQKYKMYKRKAKDMSRQLEEMHDKLKEKSSKVDELENELY